MKLKERISLTQIFQFLTVGLLLVLPASAWAQTVVATVTAGSAPEGVAVNKVTNKIYVTNFVSNNVTVIDGATNSTITVPTGPRPVAVAVNETTNEIYVANRGCGIVDTCSGGINGSITVIDGATNFPTTVTDPNAIGPFAVAVNSVTNIIYVANYYSGNLTVLDGTTNSTTTVVGPNVASTHGVAVNSVTNKIYIADSNNVTVIDGATNATITVTDPNAIGPYALAVDSVTNKIYVANTGLAPANTGNITVIDGVTNATTTITDPNGQFPQDVTVNETTNKIYVVNANDPSLSQNGGVTAIDGTDNSFVNIKDSNAVSPNAVTVDSVTNTIYVANQGCFLDDPCINRGSVTVINGATNSVTTIIDPNASNPTGLALDPTTDKIYVAGGKVTVIDGGATPKTHILSLLLSGNGNGAVTSIPSGLDCGTSCIASFTAGTDLTLTASPASGVKFSGWSTNCTGTGACDLTMNSDEFVAATFTSDTASDFSLQVSGSSMVQSGTQITDVITIAPMGGTFYGTAVQLSCAVAIQLGAPMINGPMPTCAVSPSSVTPGANSVTSMLTITAPGQSAGLIPPKHGQRARALYATFLPFPAIALIWVCLARGTSRTQRCQLWLLCGLFAAFVVSQAGCGGGSGQQTHPQGQQNYTVTITATSGAIQHTAQVTLIVQP